MSTRHIYGQKPFVTCGTWKINRPNGAVALVLAHGETGWAGFCYGPEITDHLLTEAIHDDKGNHIGFDVRIPDAVLFEYKEIKHEE